MNRPSLWCAAALGALWLELAAVPVNAATIDISGALDVILVDDGTGVFAGTPNGTSFSGFISDTTFNGQLSDGSTVVNFGCCIDAGGLTIFNNEVLDADLAALFNQLAGSSIFNAGDVIDGVDIEGDAATTSGGRIEIGVSYVLPGTTFADTQPGNYPFDPSAVQLAVFFIFEENATGTEIFNAAGPLVTTPIPEPSTIALWVVGVAMLPIAIMRRRRGG